MMFDYNVSFEVNGERKYKNLIAPHIHDVIRKVRVEYPEACMFRVLRKVKVEQSESRSSIRVF